MNLLPYVGHQFDFIAQTFIVDLRASINYLDLNRQALSKIIWIQVSVHGVDITLSSLYMSYRSPCTHTDTRNVIMNHHVHRSISPEDSGFTMSCFLLERFLLTPS